MKTESWLGRETLRLVVLVLPFFFLVAFWEQLPGGKFWKVVQLSNPASFSRHHLLALALLNLLLYGAFQLRHRYWPRHMPDSPKSWQILQLVCHQLVTMTLFLTAFRALGFTLAPVLLLQYSIITLLFVLGSFLGDIPRNTMFGFRLTWTLNNDLIWQKTHRFAAHVWVYTSFMMLLNPRWQAYEWIFPLYVGLLVLSPIIYSYLAHRQHLKTH